MTAPSISVIIPVFNTPRQDLEKCICCLGDQTFDDYECIVIDDGSVKETASALDDLCVSNNKVTVLHTPNRGVSSARNLGIAKAQGEAICFVDADDYFAPWMLEDLWASYTVSEEVGTVCAYFRIVENDSYIFERNVLPVALVDNSKILKNVLVGTACKDSGLDFLSAGPYATLVQAEYAKSHPFSVEFKYMEDTIWNLQHFSSAGKTAILKEVVYAYKINPYSATHTFDPSVISNRLKALERLAQKADPSLDEWLGLRALANYYLCCKCIMWSSRPTGILERLSDARTLGKNPIWGLFKHPGVSRSWSVRDRCKRWLAMTGFLPLALAMKGEKNDITNE